jgi:hypothetical protein
VPFGDAASVPPREMKVLAESGGVALGDTGKAFALLQRGGL